MSFTRLLSKEYNNVDRLVLSRIQLDAVQPSLMFHTHGKEGLLYGLVGKFNVYANGLYLGSYDSGISIENHRGNNIVVCRFPAHNEYDISITMRSHAADLLWMTCEPLVPYATTTTAHMSPIAPYMHVRDSVWHDVGHGTHQRSVCELPTPPGYEIATGETHNIIGGISSWPPHATPEDIERFSNGETTWEEAMFYIGDGFADLRGVYTGGSIVNKIMPIHNGEAHVMPLGSHAIYSKVDCNLKYVWFYCGSALKKFYNSFSDDLNVYKK